MSASKIQGRGLFAKAAIPAGVVVIRLGGRLVDTQSLRELFTAAHDSGEFVDTVQIGSDTHLVLPNGTDVHFGNHSCDPNLWHHGPYDIVTRRSIEAFEEITIDYGTSTVLSDFEMPCGCGSTVCRGTVRGNDWQRPELQTRYGDHWLPAALDLLRAGN